MSQFYKAHGFERTNAGNANKVFLHAFLQFLQKPFISHEIFNILL